MVNKDVYILSGLNVSLKVLILVHYCWLCILPPVSTLILSLSLNHHL